MITPLGYPQSTGVTTSGTNQNSSIITNGSSQTGSVSTGQKVTKKRHVSEDNVTTQQQQ
jgi:hypothetical protein